VGAFNKPYHTKLQAKTAIMAIDKDGLNIYFDAEIEVIMAEVKMITPQQKFGVHCSKEAVEWLYDQNISLVISSGKFGRLFFFGSNDDKKLAVFDRTFDSVSAIHYRGKELYYSTGYQIWRMQDSLPEGKRHNGHDALYIPQISYITGDLDISDITQDISGRLLFVSQLFSCVGTNSNTHSFKPVWRPDFITKLSPENRCGLTGLSIKDGVLRYVTASAETDVEEGWKKDVVGSGVVIDVSTNQIICKGLTRPYAPRWHDGKLWLLNSGKAQFGYVDMLKSEFIPVLRVDGYPTGLKIYGRYAYITCSRGSYPETYENLPIKNILVESQKKPMNGVYIIDLATNKMLHSFEVAGEYDILPDIDVITGARNPMAIGLRTEQIKQTISIE
jgi:uncharacterized protein (TIGR03032 family)